MSLIWLSILLGLILINLILCVYNMMLYRRQHPFKDIHASHHSASVDSLSTKSVKSKKISKRSIKKRKLEKKVIPPPVIKAPKKIQTYETAKKPEIPKPLGPFVKKIEEKKPSVVLEKKEKKEEKKVEEKKEKKESIVTKSLKDKQLQKYVIEFKPVKDASAENHQKIIDSFIKQFGSSAIHEYVHGDAPAICMMLTEDQAKSLSKLSTVDTVRPDFVMSALWIKGFKGVNANAGQVTPWGINRINGCNTTVSHCDGKSQGPLTASKVHVFVIDTGVTNPDINVVEAKSFVTWESGTNDLAGHGTHVSGTIAAIDNTTYVVGVAPKTNIHNIRVLDSDGNGTYSSVLAGVQYVLLQAVRNPTWSIVVNMSLGATTGTTSLNALDRGIQSLIRAGVTVVVAAGNESANTAFTSPAHTPGVIAVGAYGSDNTFAYFSNYGSMVSLLAPGVNVLSTISNLTQEFGPNAKTATMSGTSMASPHVAGAAALYLSQFPKTSPAGVLTALKLRATQASQSLITSVPSNTTNKSVWAL